jgi:hypothetical protein
MKLNFEMNLKFNTVADFGDTTLEELKEVGHTEQTLRELFKKVMKEDLDLLLIVDSDELKANYKITKIKVTIEEE